MRAISVDLRIRACDAVFEDGLSRRKAARQFKVSVSSVIRWCTQAKASGDLTPQKQGGDRLSGRTEAQADFILERIALKRDITLKELQAELLAERGVRVSIGALWRFFHRRQITLKKRRSMLLSRIAPTSRLAGSNGATCSVISIPGG